MAEQRYFLVKLTRYKGSSPYLTTSEVAGRCGVHPELIGRLVDLGLIDLADRDDSGEALFNADVIAMVRKILRLRNQLGVNYAGIGVVLELMSRIESMEAYIRELESKIFGGGS